MAYGSYNRGGYGNNGSYQQQPGGYGNGGGYQKPQLQPVDVHAEIVNRIQLYQQFRQVATSELGIADDEFILMAPMLGGWITSILLKQEKGK